MKLDGSLFKNISNVIPYSLASAASEFPSAANCLLPCNRGILFGCKRLTQAAGAEPITQTDVVDLLAQIETLIAQADLPEDIKDEAATYAKAAKKSAEKDEPKKDTIKTNLQSMGETITTASKTVDAAKGLWKTVLPISLKVSTWLGITALFG